MIRRAPSFESTSSNSGSLEKDMDSTFSAQSFNWENISRFSLSLQTPPIIDDIFEKNLVTQTFSAKMTQKAVAWLLTVAWTKDYCLQTSWTALMLFYGYKSKKVIQKSQLESLCTNLSI